MVGACPLTDKLDISLQEAEQATLLLAAAAAAAAAAFAFAFAFALLAALALEPFLRNVRTLYSPSPEGNTAYKSHI
jgi:hypothetical protein